jgi:hypothetical protein
MSSLSCMFLANISINPTYFLHQVAYFVHILCIYNAYAIVCIFSAYHCIFSTHHCIWMHIGCVFHTCLCNSIAYLLNMPASWSHGPVSPAALRPCPSQAFLSLPGTPISCPGTPTAPLTPPTLADPSDPNICLCPALWCYPPPLRQPPSSSRWSLHPRTLLNQPGFHPSAIYCAYLLHSSSVSLCHDLPPPCFPLVLGHVGSLSHCNDLAKACFMLEKGRYQK